MKKNYAQWGFFNEGKGSLLVCMHEYFGMSSTQEKSDLIEQLNTHLTLPDKIDFALQCGAQNDFVQHLLAKGKDDYTTEALMSEYTSRNEKDLTQSQKDFLLDFVATRVSEYLQSDECAYRARIAKSSSERDVYVNIMRLHKIDTYALSQKAMKEPTPDNVAIFVAMLTREDGTFFIKQNRFRNRKELSFGKAMYYMNVFSTLIHAVNDLRNDAAFIAGVEWVCDELLVILRKTNADALFAKVLKKDVKESIRAKNFLVWRTENKVLEEKLTELCKRLQIPVYANT